MKASKKTKNPETIRRECAERFEKGSAIMARLSEVIERFEKSLTEFTKLLKGDAVDPKRGVLWRLEVLEQAAKLRRSLCLSVFVWIARLFAAAIIAIVTAIITLKIKSN